MKEMSKYCKAYPIDVFFAFEDWNVKIPYRYSVQKDEKEVSETVEISIDSGDYVFLHDCFSVTADIYSQELIIFKSQDDRFIQFCKDNLSFNIPDNL